MKEKHQMGYFSEYIDKRLSFDQISSERKAQLRHISELRGRAVLVYASDPTKNAHSEIYYPDITPFKDQLSFITTPGVDVILETPGGYAEVVEDMVNLLRLKHEKVGIIIPGSAKSAGTIFAMAGDEILMGETSALGPIDAQVSANGKTFSADAFLDGLDKIKREVETTGRLNPAYIPMLQAISPGEIQHFENAQSFSRTLVTNWLKTYKFKYWDHHKTNGQPVTDAEKEKRANDIAAKLCKHGDWLTHGRSIRIADLENMRLLINDYSKNAELCEAIERYYTLLKITFEMTGIYKIYETCNSQIYQSVAPIQQAPQNLPSQDVNKGMMDFSCPKCNNTYKIQLNLMAGVPLELGVLKYPANDIFICPTCGTGTNIVGAKLQTEAITGKKVIFD